MVGGTRKKVTRSNIRGGKIEWYKRSDGKVALRDYKKDRSTKATKKPSGKKRGFEGDY